MIETVPAYNVDEVEIEVERFTPATVSRLPYRTHLFFKSCTSLSADQGDYIAIARAHGHVVGAFGFVPPKKGSRGRRRVLIAAGTHVEPNARRRGIAERLWRFVIGYTRARAVSVTTGSVDGECFVAAMAERLKPVSEVEAI